MRQRAAKGLLIEKMYFAGDERQAEGRAETERPSRHM